MAVAVSVPHLKNAPDEPSIHGFAQQLESMLDLRNLPYYIVRGTSLKKMLDLSTSQARGTSYNTELVTALGVSNLHIELHAYDFDTNEEWSDSDFIIGELHGDILDDNYGYSNEILIKKVNDKIDEFAEVNIVTLRPSEHYSSVLSELLYDISSIILYVNVDSYELFPTVAESITDIIWDFVDHRTSSDHSEESIEDNPMLH